MNQCWDKTIELAAETGRRYRISALEPLLASCRAAAAPERRLDELLATVTRLRADLESLHSAREELRTANSQEVAG